MGFEPNVGQANPHARFLAHGSGYTTFLTPKEALLILRAPSNSTVAPALLKTSATKLPATETRVSVLSMRLVGVSPKTRLVARDPLPGKTNYLLGKDPAKWHTNIPNYRKVEEQSVYPGIDLMYYGTQQELEYDFLVAPGGEPGRIRLAIGGAKKLRIDSRGDLEASIAAGVVKFHKPVAYQLMDGKRSNVVANYVLEHSHIVSLKLAQYDRTLPLVIDPILSYSTYLGGSGIDVANGIAVAADNTAFVAGGTFSGDFPTAHPLQPNVGGPLDFPQDAFVTKISADGSTLLYSTYLGGNSTDVAHGVAVDLLGDAYVTGTTTSTDFPVTPLVAFPNCGGDGACGGTLNVNNLIVENGFVSKLNPAGSALAYSTYIGFDEHVSCNAIAVDNNDIVYLTGQTTAVVSAAGSSFPTTSTAFQPTFVGGATDGFVMTLSATGASVLYSSFLGGTGEDLGKGIAADNSGRAYVAGLTYSSDFPVLNGVDSTYGGAGDAFFSLMDTNGSGGSSLLYSTYLGGTGIDQANAVAMDSSGTAYVAGVTASSSFTGIASPLTSYGGDSDGFVARLDPAQSGSASVLYFLYVGGKLADAANGIAVDSLGNAYVTGFTVSTDFPTSADAFQPAFGGGNADGFVTKLSSAGSTVYSSYLGGTNTDVANGIAVDANGSAYVTGQTCSLDFPLAHPVQAAAGGNCDAFVSKVSTQGGIVLNPAGLVFTAQSLGTTSTTQTVTLTNDDTSTATINGITIVGNNPGDFAQTNDCGSSVVAGGTCTFSVTFTPTATGTRNAQIQITDTATNSPQTISLSGSTSTLQLSSSTLSFGDEMIGATSPAQSVTATNLGTTAITFTGITASGAFSETDDCTKVPLQPSTNCTINVTFSPVAAGSAVGALMLSDDAPGSPQEVLLTGTGVAASSQLLLSPTSLDFGGQNVGATSPPQTVSVTNQGTVAVTFASITASGPFAETDTCTQAPLQPGAGCSISVTFTPVASGSASGSLTLSDDAPGSPQVVPLTGNGSTQQSDFTISAQPPSDTISAGQTAAYTLTLTPIGTFSQAVSLTCSGLPAQAKCSVSTNPVNLSGATNVNLQISTAARTAVPAMPRTPMGPLNNVQILLCAWLGLLLLTLLLSAVSPGWRVRRTFSVLALAVTVALLSSACNGGTRSGVVSGTPAGTYQVTVAGTAGSLSHKATVSLQVK